MIIADNSREKGRKLTSEKQVSKNCTVPQKTWGRLSLIRWEKSRDARWIRSNLSVTRRLESIVG